MLDTVKQFPAALGRELKRQFPIIETAEKAAKGELVPKDLAATKPLVAFKTGLFNGGKDSPAGSPGAGNIPTDSECARAYALGSVMNASLRSAASLATFWVVGNALNASASALFGGLGHAFQAAIHGNLLDGLKGVGEAVKSAAFHPQDFGKILNTFAAGGAFVNMADGAVQEQSGAVSQIKKVIVDGKFPIIQGAAIAVGLLTGCMFIPAGVYLGSMVAKAVKDAQMAAAAKKGT